MILIVKTNANPLHDLEFVRPVQDIVEKAGGQVKSVHYSKLSPALLKQARKVIICGTSLKDFRYLKDLKKFSWLLKFEKPVLGICAGAHVMAKTFGASLEKSPEIGLTEVQFSGDFFGMLETQNVYELHNLGIKDDIVFRKNFDVFAFNDQLQAFQVSGKPFFAILSHPEVRQKELLVQFVQSIANNLVDRHGLP